MRISADEKVPGGITIEDAKVIAMLLEENGLDLMNVSAAVNASVQYVTPPAAVRHGVYVDLAEEIKQVVSIPVIGVGRVNDPFLAEAVLESGKCDLVGMLRALMETQSCQIKQRRVDSRISRHVWDVLSDVPGTWQKESLPPVFLIL